MPADGRNRVIQELQDELAAERAHADEFAEECRDWSCDFHYGKPATPDTPTYCFTCMERFPCSGERLRRLADAHDARRKARR